MLGKLPLIHKRVLCTMVLALAAVPVVAKAKSFGVHSTEDYEGAWCPPLPGADTCMSRMIGVLDDNATSKFWYGLEGKQWYWHQTGDTQPNSLETVDMFVAFTHGRAYDTKASWGMWDWWVTADSPQMSLGQGAPGSTMPGLSIFTQFSCETLKFDANTWTRWDSIFYGGLRAALGSHDLLYFRDGGQEMNVGKVYAQYLNAGRSLKDSWAAGWNLAVDNIQDVAVMFTGTSDADCDTRMFNMNWNNFNSYPRLGPTTMRTHCGWIWDDI